jgi:TATA-binding protein-associated factor Taf7
MTDCDDMLRKWKDHWDDVADEFIQKVLNRDYEYVNTYVDRLIDIDMSARNVVTTCIDLNRMKQEE